MCVHVCECVCGGGGGGDLHPPNPDIHDAMWVPGSEAGEEAVRA